MLFSSLNKCSYFYDYTKEEKVLSLCFTGDQQLESVLLKRTLTSSPDCGAGLLGFRFVSAVYKALEL